MPTRCSGGWRSAPSSWTSATVELEESHAYHIDYPGLAATREALLGFGARLLAQGRIDSREDVFYLRRDELRGALADDWGPPLHAVVDERRRERGDAVNRS